MNRCGGVGWGEKRRIELRVELFGAERINVGGGWRKGDGIEVRGNGRERVDRSARGTERGLFSLFMQFGKL